MEFPTYDPMSAYEPKHHSVYSTNTRTRSWHLKSEKQTEVPSYFVDWWNAKSWSRRVCMKKGFLQCCFAFMAWLFLFFFQINVIGTNKRTLDSLDYNIKYQTVSLFTLHYIRLNSTMHSFSMNKITKTWIQNSRQNWNEFFSSKIAIRWYCN